MTLYGWMGSTPTRARPTEILRAMAAGLTAVAEAQHNPSSGVSIGLGVETGFDGGVIHQDHRYCAAIAGTPYWSDPELSQLAVKRGHAVALIEAFRRDNVGLFRHLHGAFVLAVADQVAGEALLAIDRFGVQTLRYAATPDGCLVFSTSADRVRAHPGVCATLAPQAIYDYLTLSVIPGGTAYKEHKALQPAHYLHWTNCVADVEAYWRMPYGRYPLAKKPAALAETLVFLLRQAVQRATSNIGASVVGAFLSGGLDSSSIAGLLGQITGQRQKTFTVGFDEAGYDEAPCARRTAEHFGAEHHEHYLTPDEVVDALPILAEAYDAPFGNASAVPVLACARLARQHHVDTLLAGDGGDELFAGNPRYADQALLERYHAVPAFLRSGLIEPFVRSTDGSELPPLRKLRNYVRRAKMPMPDRVYGSNGLWHQDHSQIFHADFLREIDVNRPLSAARDAYHNGCAVTMLHRMLQMDLQISLADNDLRKVTTMCRQAGVAVRFPFLDQDLAEFAAGLSPHMLMRGRQLRTFYRRALRHFLPAETLRKRKQGFGLPYVPWARTHPRLMQAVAEAVMAFKRRPYCRASHLDGLLLAYRCGDDAAANRLWDIMMLEMWLQFRRLQ